MPREATFKWRDVYFQFAQGIDPTATDPDRPVVKLRRPYGELTLAEARNIDLRETQGRRETVKAIFKCQRGYMVITTLEGHKEGSVYYF